ncbi:MAG TPA: PQQ-dependent sugar dehydrogenase [Verrucomicrobiae bacterium]|jgi:putative heme-binding domain-containing protein
MKSLLTGVWIVFALGVGCLCSLAQPVPVPGSATNEVAYEKFAMVQAGDAAHGQQVFTNLQAAGCVRCHTTDGSSGRVGPDLFAIADKFPRADLIRAVLKPSAEIDVGYDTTLITTKDDESYSGIIKQTTDEWVNLMGWDGKVFHIPTANIQSLTTSPTSFMPAGLQSTMSPQDFADLIAYLSTLHQSAQNAGMPAQIPLATQSITFRSFFGSDLKFEHPVWFCDVPGFTNRFVVLEHAGKSWLVERTVTGDKKSVLMDLSHTVRYGGATGLLGLAFHPHFAQNRKYYLTYQTLVGNDIYSVVVERRFAADFLGDSGEAGREIIRIPAVTQDHNGACLGFGPDGYLYLSMGDSGPQRDPEGHAQNLKLLLGKILRLDVDHPADGREYGIPLDNPFRNNTNALPEIWAYGLREPWRFSFDHATGDLWVGDVGQDRFEEVSIVRAGENEGWNIYEGFTPFSEQYRRPREQYVSPVFSYSHHEGVSVTGGYVYHGQKAPAMRGKYIFGDFQIGRVWALTETNRQLTSILEIGRSPSRFASFGEDAAGELYLVGYDSGLIYKLDFSTLDPTPVAPKTQN